MRRALQLARTQLGRVSPNPAVGCVIVKNARIVGIGATQPGGRPHAETQALHMAGGDAKGATLYVTLEPCSHHGQTAPCAQAIIDAGIATVICATRDPDPRVNGQGIAMLKQAGLDMIEHICEQEAFALNEGFFRRVTDHRPFITVKIASSLDGKIATASGESQWITGPAARNYGHALRASHDAILTGIGTVLADNPALTCRIAGRESDSPQRIVLDRQNRLPTNAAIHPCWQLSAQTLSEAMHAIAEKGITRLLVEAGPTLNTALLRASLVDEIHWLRAPFSIGDDGRDALSTLTQSALNDIARWQPIRRFCLGEDECAVYRVSACL